MTFAFPDALGESLPTFAEFGKLVPLKVLLGFGLDGSLHRFSRLMNPLPYARFVYRSRHLTLMDIHSAHREHYVKLVI